MKKATLFLPSFFAWLFVYSLVDYAFSLAGIKDKVFYHLYGGYDFSLKIVISWVFQSGILSIVFHKFSKENYIFSLIRGCLVSGFFYVFIYILLTGIYLKL